MTKLFARTEVHDLVETDKHLRDWWRKSGLSKRDFVHNNRTTIEAYINFKQADDYRCVKCGQKRWICDRCRVEQHPVHPANIETAMLYGKTQTMGVVTRKKQ